MAILLAVVRSLRGMANSYDRNLVQGAAALRGGERVYDAHSA